MLSVIFMDDSPGNVNIFHGCRGNLNLPCFLCLIHFFVHCGEPAISLHSHTVPLVQWSNRLLPVMRDLGSIPRGVLTVCETGILLLALSRYIGDPDVIDHCGLV
jgi:hypothetical protein